MTLAPTTSPRRAVALAAVTALAGCAGLRPAPAAAPAAPPKAPVVAFEPEVVKATSLDVELAGKNDEELFAVGEAAFAANDFERAATAFARLADRFPTSKREAAALYDAGLAYQRLGAWRLALERFRALARKYEGPDAVEAQFRVAECRWHLEEHEDAFAILDGLARREDLPPRERIRALAQRGVVELELDRTEEAEKTLRLAVSSWKGASDAERLDPYFAAQAQYYLGEVFRRHFLAVKLDPAAETPERLGAALETKAELLLSAQGHYLRAIRMGDADWAVASGFRVGELYDELHGHLVNAALPPGLDDEHAAAYRAELRKKVRVLVTKAIAIYEQTLQAAGRTRVDNPFVERTKASLDKMRGLLAADRDDPASGGAPRALPADADPGAR